MAFFGRKSNVNVPEIDVKGDEFSVRQPDGAEPDPAEAGAQPEPIPVPAATERKGKIPPHSWGI